MGRFHKSQPGRTVLTLLKDHFANTFSSAASSCIIEMLHRSCMWAFIKNCSLSSNNCLPSWICDCIMPEGETETLCQTCDLHCWNACPPWSEWASVSSPRFWAAVSEFRQRACPCDFGQTYRPGSQIFQSDISTGRCLQARVSVELNSFSWEFLYVCFFLLCVLFMFWMRECVNEYKAKGKSMKENEMPQKKETFKEEYNDGNNEEDCV